MENNIEKTIEEKMEEIILKLNWDYLSDPGRYQLWDGLIKPAMKAAYNLRGEEDIKAIKEIGRNLIYKRDAIEEITKNDIK